MQNGEDHDAITELKAQCAIHCNQTKSVQESTKAEMKAGFAKIDVSFASLKAQLDRDYVRRVEFLPVQRLVYGMVALTLAGALGAVIKLIIHT